MTLSTIRFALAQLEVTPCDIESNITKHGRLCVEAARHDADVIVFPELSLTGYELPSLQRLAIEQQSPLIQRLSDIASTQQITIVAGSPLSGPEKTRHGLTKADRNPNIGAIISHPNGHTDFYSKQYLHGGESEFCCAGEQDYSFSVNGFNIFLAICADFTEPLHYKSAREHNAHIYLASALISQPGFEADSQILAGIAEGLECPVLLSNYIGNTGGWDTAGQCSVWDKHGHLVAQGSHVEEGITLCTIEHGATGSREIIRDIEFVYC
ncbi:carbon-nitrogen hydrolase family protein [Photobacterium rosenbergii]|uniref:carbon-nitrogen hydrolase family protein n=1 Tax=Photobacterium rosenbergii TaxID=294936 RepID=UPI001C99DE8A|nr:carbon-nitrogen hydrolase family protein [Photobacterium rosenbergii]MBY5946860.1 carbon-nitrogen hydrolase family protein [Photobacterium rosenbergii]